MPSAKVKSELTNGPMHEEAATSAVQALPSSVQNEALMATKDVQSLTSTFDELRSLITCKICFRMLYEPYTNSCGHTFCYSCLSQWFSNAEHKKSCPDCRASIKHTPAPAYIVRDMTQKFIKNPALLPEGETAEQHEQWRKEEADVVELDRANPDATKGGLFKGCFHERTQGRTVIRDVEDGVDRCPSCAWELEGQDLCSHCGHNLQYDSENEYSGSSEDEEEEMEPQHGHNGSGWSDEDSEDLDADIDEADPDVDGGFATFSDLEQGAFPRFSQDGSDASDASMTDAYDDNAPPPPGVSRGAFLHLRDMERHIRDQRFPPPPHTYPRMGPPASLAHYPHRPDMGYSSTGSSVTSSQDEDEDVESVEDDEDNDDEESDSEDDSVMNDFIDDEVEEADSCESDTSDSTPRQVSPPSRRRRSRPQVIDSDDEDEFDGSEGPSRSSAASASTLSHPIQERTFTSDEEDENDEPMDAPVLQGTYTSDESEDDDEVEGGGVSNRTRRS